MLFRQTSPYVLDHHEEVHRQDDKPEASLPLHCSIDEKSIIFFLFIFHFFWSLHLHPSASLLLCYFPEMLIFLMGSVFFQDLEIRLHSLA